MKNVDTLELLRLSSPSAEGQTVSVRTALQQSCGWSPGAVLCELHQYRSTHHTLLLPNDESSTEARASRRFGLGQTDYWEGGRENGFRARARKRLLEPSRYLLRIRETVLRGGGTGCCKLKVPLNETGEALCGGTAAHKHTGTRLDLSGI